MMYLEQIETIVEVKRGRNGRRGVKLAFYGKFASLFWMSAKQFDRLQKSFDETPNGYSCKKITVYGVFKRVDGGEYYVWSGVHSPLKSDLEFLCKHFGVEMPEEACADLAMVKVPDHVEVHPDLLG